VVIHLFHGTGPQQPHRDLWEEVDDRTVITPELLNTFLLSERPDRPQQDRHESSSGGGEREESVRQPRVYSSERAPARTPRPTYTSPSSYARESYPSGRGWPEGLPNVDDEEEL
jgi:hypothetical protein